MELISETTYKYRIILQVGILKKSITNFFSGKIVQEEKEKEPKGNLSLQFLKKASLDKETIAWAYSFV